MIDVARAPSAAKRNLAQNRPKKPTSRLKSIFRVGYSSYDRFEKHDGTALAGFVAFSAFLSLFPFAIFLSALAGFAIGPADSRDIFDALVKLAPEHIAETLMPVLNEIINQDRGGVLTISALGAIWVASNAVEAIRVAFDRAYAPEKLRSFVRRRSYAILFVIFAAAIFTLIGVVIIGAPLAIRLFQNFTGVTVPFGIGVLRYVIGLGAFWLFLFMLHRWLPSKAPKSRQIIPGLVVSTALWILSASGFSIYLAYAPDYALTYGAFAGVIVTLLFFYLTAAILIFGAEVNAAMLAEAGEKIEFDDDDEDDAAAPAPA